MTSIKICINEDLCKGCGFCIASCPRKVLAFSKELSPKGFLPAEPKNPEDCVMCRFCEIICPDFSISIVDGNQARCALTKASKE